MPEEKTILTVCPSCGEKYTLTADLIGQVAECTKCGVEFTIAEAAPAESPVGETPAAPASAPAPEEKPAGTSSTSTTRIPKITGRRIGMVPNVDDKFNLGVVKSTQTATHIKQNAVPEQKPAEKKPWWKIW